MKSILLLLSMVMCINVFAQGPQPEFTLSATQSCPYTDITITNTTTPSSQIIAWNWTFENGVPSTYSGQNPPLEQWEKEGEHWVTLEIIVGCEIGDPVDPFDRTAEGLCPYTVSFQLPITIDARCCPDLPIYAQDMLNNGIVVDKAYKVVSDLVISNGSVLEVQDGSLLFDGNAIPAIKEPGGYSNGPFVYANSGGVINIIEGNLKAYCDEMWGGLAMAGGSSIEIHHSNFEDSYAGIFADEFANPLTNNFDINLMDNDFLNNYKTLTFLESGALQNFHLNIIKVDPNEMRSPLNTQDPNNAGEHFLGFYGFYFGEKVNLSANEINNNTFENLMVGIAHYPGVGYGGLYVYECNFINNVLSGIHVKGTEDFYFFGNYHEIPVDPEPNWNFNEAVKFFCPKLQGSCINPVLYNSATFGIFVETMSADMYVESCLFTTPSLNYDENFNFTRERIGVKVPLAVDSDPLYVDGTTFKNLHEAIQITDTEKMVIEKNIFENCIYGIKVKNNASPIKTYDLIMTCNEFKQPYNHTFNRYGLYLESGSALDDIGGANSINAPDMPSGNGFPVDPVVSQPRGWDPIPANACFGSGCAGDAGEWQVPGGWYSIYDGNATSNTSIPSFRYYRYDNEFVGDLNNHSSVFGVYPNGGFFSIVEPTSIEATMFNPQIGSPPPTCGTNSSIPFPDVRIMDLKKGMDGELLDVYPNPITTSSFTIESQKEIMHLSLLTLEGQELEYLEYEVIGNNLFRLELSSQISNGIYFLKVGSSQRTELLKLVLAR